jgi:hypothetical protein
MADHSKDRKKALVMLVLLFLFAGGGIFLYFIIQGANDLTGAGKGNTFTYSGAVREGVSSFFKYIGFDSEESSLAKCKQAVDAVREEKAVAAEGISDWTASKDDGGGSASARPVTPTSVPKMGGGGMSGVGGGGGGGTNSSSRISRFGGEDGAGSVSVKAGQASGSGLTKKSATMDALKRANTQMGDALRSGSAMTAKGKWDASFGVGGGAGRSGDMAYGKAGLVGLDKIKTGEIASLKTTDPKSLNVPKPDPLVDKDAQAKDKNLNAAMAKAADDAAKKAAEQAMISAAGNSLNSSKPDTKTTDSGTDRGGPATSRDVPSQVTDTVKTMLLQDVPLGGDVRYSDTTATIGAPDSSGNYPVSYTGKTSDGTTITTTYAISPAGKYLGPR